MGNECMRGPPALLGTHCRAGVSGRPHRLLAAPAHAADQVQQGLAAWRINVSVSRVGSTRFYFEQRQLSEVVRASVHYFNTEDELQRCVDAVRQLAAAAAAAGTGQG